MRSFRMFVLSAASAALLVGPVVYAQASSGHSKPLRSSWSVRHHKTGGARLR